MYVFVLMFLVVFCNNRKMYISSGIYIYLLLHNIGNDKNDFMFSLNLFRVDEKANIL